MKKIIMCSMYIIFLCCSCQSNEVTNVSSIENKNEIIETEDSNPYFSVKEDTSHEFQGQIFFDCFGDIPIPECKTVINFEKIAKLKKGFLYHLTIDPISGLNIPEERLSVGYFYVQGDKIIRIWDNADYEAEGNVWDISQEALKDLVDNDIIPKDSAVVCQENEIKDTLDEGESGWHQYLKVDGTRRRYGGFYQYPQHSGYWETFIWEKGTGLVCYQSGIEMVLIILN